MCVLSSFLFSLSGWEARVSAIQRRHIHVRSSRTLLTLGCALQNPSNLQRRPSERAGCANCFSALRTLLRTPVFSFQNSTISYKFVLIYFESSNDPSALSRTISDERSLSAPLTSPHVPLSAHNECFMAIINC